MTEALTKCPAEIGPEIRRTAGRGEPRTRPGATPAIRVRELRHHYADLEVVGGLDLDVWPGEVYAFLGPNGAGKTTTVEILEGFLAPTSGEADVLGVNPATA